MILSLNLLTISSVMRIDMIFWIPFLPPSQPVQWHAGPRSPPAAEGRPGCWRDPRCGSPVQAALLHPAGGRQEPQLQPSQPGDRRGEGEGRRASRREGEGRWRGQGQGQGQRPERSDRRRGGGQQQVCSPDERWNLRLVRTQPQQPPGIKDIPAVVQLLEVHRSLLLALLWAHFNVPPSG